MIYFDNSATTPVCPEAAQAIAFSLENEYGNPSSRHFLGVRAGEQLDTAAQVIAKKLGAAREEIYFTSGGTEANNLAVFGAVNAARKFRGKKRIVVSAMEHSSVFESAKRLESEGYDVVYLAPDRHGNIAAQQLAQAIDENTILVSMMLVNNELGSVLPATAVKGIIRAKGAPALFHCDCVQAFCKVPFTVKSLGADLVSVSAHKIFGPKGVGALYVKKGVRLVPQTVGGEQEGKLRPGTQATALIAGFAAAVSAYRSKEYVAAVTALNHYVREQLAQIPQVVFNSDEKASPYILNCSVPGYRSEVLLNYFSAKEICVSAGSACAKGKPSHVLASISADKKITDSALRLSFSHQNTREEADIFVRELKTALQTLAHE